MRFLSLFTPDPKTAAAPPTPEHQNEMRRFAEEMMRSGVLVATGAFLPAALGARVRSQGGNIRVLDGASESAPPSVGFALLEVASKEAAIEATRRFIKIAGDGEAELLALMGRDAAS
jgi:hypothetical protein